MTNSLTLKALGVEVVDAVYHSRWNTVYSCYKDCYNIGWCWPIESNEQQPIAQLEKMFLGLKLNKILHANRVHAWIVLGEYILDKEINTHIIKVPTLLEIQNDALQKSIFWQQWCKLDKHLYI